MPLLILTYHKGSLKNAGESIIMKTGLGPVDHLLH